MHLGALGTFREIEMLSYTVKSNCTFFSAVLIMLLCIRFLCLTM